MEMLIQHCQHLLFIAYGPERRMPGEAGRTGGEKKRLTRRPAYLGPLLSAHEGCLSCKHHTVAVKSCMSGRLSPSPVPRGPHWFSFS